MEKVYKSKVAVLYLCACIAMGTAFVVSLLLCYKFVLILLVDVVFVGFGLWLMLDMLFHTDYTIRGNVLHIRCGFLYRMTLPISKIKEITLRTTILSSPALSAKRIGLRYGRRSTVYISPQNQNDFIADLKSVNPEIKVVGY